MIDKEQIEKIETLENLLISIQNKTKTIVNQTKFLKTFNKKLEILLMCFKAYSFDDKDFIGNEESNIEGIKNIQENKKNTESSSLKEIQNDLKNRRSSYNDEIPETIKNGFDLNSMTEQIFGTNLLQKTLANSIIDLIRTKISISLDDLVKNIKSSKYKVIDVLNILIREKIIIKSFEKGFVYRISKEIR